MELDVTQIARVVHEANRAFCESIGDISQLPWDSAPEWQHNSAIAGVNAHLTAHKHGCYLSSSSTHALWMTKKLSDGWTYGPVKDAEKKEHPCLVSYNQLPIEQHMKDHLFRAIVGAFLVGIK